MLVGQTLLRPWLAVAFAAEATILVGVGAHALTILATPAIHASSVREVVS